MEEKYIITLTFFHLFNPELLFLKQLCLYTTMVTIMYYLLFQSIAPAFSP
jgi:hypothetical protein